MKRFRFVQLVVVAGMLAWSAGSFAQAGTEVQTIWRCIDSAGKTYVTNVKEETVGKQCKVIQTERVSIKPAPIGRTAAKSPAGFPKESSGEREKARERQRTTLERELGSEEALLTKAKAELAEQESIRNGDERNYAKVLERLQKYKDNVQLHQKNVDELRKEIDKLK